MTGMLILPVRVYLEDTDAQGVVYNASYIRFFERARTEWLRSRGIDHNELRENTNLMLVLANIEASFRVPAKLDDMLQVSAEVVEVSAVRFLFHQDIRRETVDGELLCRGVAKVACVDTRTGRPRRLPGYAIAYLNKDESEG